MRVAGHVIQLSDPEGISDDSSAPFTPKVWQWEVDRYEQGQEAVFGIIPYKRVTDQDIAPGGKLQSK